MVELEFGINPRIVPIVRRFVSEFYGAVFPHEEAVSQLALVTHELMENAVKYSAGNESCLAVECREVGDRREVAVRIRNSARPEQIEQVRVLLEAMQRATNPLDFYLTRMAESALETEGSGLGLVRIYAEAGMTLTHRVDGDWIEITATSTYSTENAQ